MQRKNHKAEEIFSTLSQVAVLVAQGIKAPDAVPSSGATRVTYYRWRRKYGGLQMWSCPVKQVRVDCEIVGPNPIGSGECQMPKKCFPDEQIATALRQTENGTTIGEICRTIVGLLQIRMPIGSFRASPKRIECFPMAMTLRFPCRSVQLGDAPLPP